MISKIEFYVPVASAEIVKSALFAAGAGRIGNYDCCAWETHGRGQFRPLKGSHPAIGQQDQVEFVEEVKVELVCSEEALSAAIRALKKAHPYETPAYQIIAIRDQESL